MNTEQTSDSPSLDRPFLTEAFGLASGPSTQSNGEAAAGANRDRLLSILDRAPCLIAVTRGPEHVLEFANLICRRLLDGSDVIGRPLATVASALGGRAFAGRLDEVLRTGASQTRGTATLQLQPEMGQARGPLFVDIVLQPVLGGDRRATGVLIEGHDVTERVLADQRQALFLDEMKHRVKNTLATVAALARLARRSAVGVDDLVDSLARRIMAISRTQDLLTVTLNGVVPVRDVLTLELTPYLSVDGPVELVCEDLRVTAQAALNLSLIVHELLSNAARYGALAAPGGRLSLRCVRGPDGGELTWREDSGRPLAPAGPPGFGTRLIETLARGRSGGVRIERRDNGLNVTLRFALAKDSAST